MSEIKLGKRNALRLETLGNRLTAGELNPQEQAEYTALIKRWEEAHRIWSARAYIPVAERRPGAVIPARRDIYRG